MLSRSKQQGDFKQDVHHLRGKKGEFNMTKKDEDNKDYKPVSSKMSYGWGWVILAGLFIQVMDKNRNGLSEQTGNFIIIIGLIFLLSFYFFLRNKLLKTEKLSRQTIMASLISGFISLVAIGMTMSFVMGLSAGIDTKRKNAELKDVSQKYYDKLKNMQQEEQQLIDSIIKEPKKLEDLQFNSSKIDAVLAFAEQKHDILRTMFNDFKAIYSRDGEKGKKKLDAITHLETIGNRQFETQKSAWTALKKYYVTNNETYFNEYTTLEQAAEKLRSEYQELSRNTF